MKPKIDAVLSYHMDPATCGVAKFNAQLATHLGVPMLAFWADTEPGFNHPLVSLKLAELSQDDKKEMFEQLLESPSNQGTFDLFLHDWEDSPLCFELTRLARRVFTGSEEIAFHCAESTALFCPSTLHDDFPRLNHVDVSVFTCGMAHKVIYDHHVTLKAMLDRSDMNYVVGVSVACHEGQPCDTVATMAAFKDIYGHRARYLGKLGDTAVVEAMETYHYTALFYAPALRENNTLAQAALRHSKEGLITNLDDWSPRDIRDCVIDINANEWPKNPPKVKQSNRYTWDNLVKALA